MLKRLGIILLAMFLMFGCTQQEIQIGIRGSIQQITLTSDGAIVLIEGRVEADTLYDKASVKINNDTIIKNNLDRTLKVSDLRTGDTVEVSFTGAVAESYPVQGLAHTIKVKD